ncbi:MAG TPA: chemotaxis protein CheA [Thermoanaerobaculia bacterium]|nr:chemotaxis protein CheA [Thermoanaerobaculia bacterium]
MEINRTDVVQVFLAESEENLGTIEQTLIALERDSGNSELVEEIFRAAHTFKGNASCVGFTALADVTHMIEDYLDQIRVGARRLTQRVISLLLDSIDVLREMVAECANGSESLRGDHAVFVEELRSAIEREDAAVPAATDTSAHAASNGDGLRSRTLRVSVEKLDGLLNLAGEVAIARGRLRQMIESREPFNRILEVHREADQLHIDLQELVMRMRMVPIGPTFRQHVRTVRDLALSERKEATLVLHGEDVELDTKVVEHLRDPLLHMIRNAVDHGIERPEERVAAGKESCGIIVLSARHESGSIVIEIRDDGAGVDRQRILGRAIERGLVGASDKIADADIDQLLFSSGLSTAKQVSDISGRGVGLDVVRRNVETLHGSVSIESVPGIGTTFSIRLPLTLAIIDGFSVGVGRETFMIPLDAVVECVEVPLDGATSIDSCGVLSLRGDPLPWVRLREVFGVLAEPPPREKVVVVECGDVRAGLVVDELHGEHQTVIKPLGPLFHGLPGIAGSSILGNGRVALIIDVPGLIFDVTQRLAASRARGNFNGANTPIRAAVAEPGRKNWMRNR